MIRTRLTDFAPKSAMSSVPSVSSSTGLFIVAEIAAYIVELTFSLRLAIRSPFVRLLVSVH